MISSPGEDQLERPKNWKSCYLSGFTSENRNALEVLIVNKLGYVTSHQGCIIINNDPRAVFTHEYDQLFAQIKGDFPDVTIHFYQ